MCTSGLQAQSKTADGKVSKTVLCFERSHNLVDKTINKMLQCSQLSTTGERGIRDLGNTQEKNLNNREVESLQKMKSPAGDS